MYAVIKTGGKQFRVSQGDTLDVEKLTGEVGEQVALDTVLFIGGNGEVKIGAPTLTDKKDNCFQKEETQGLQPQARTQAEANEA